MSSHFRGNRQGGNNFRQSGGVGTTALAMSSALELAAATGLSGLIECGRVEAAWKDAIQDEAAGAIWVAGADAASGM